MTNNDAYTSSVRQRVHSENNTSFIAGYLSAILPIIIERNRLGSVAINKLIAALVAYPVKSITIQVFIKKNIPVPALEKNITVAYAGADIWLITQCAFNRQALCA